MEHTIDPLIYRIFLLLRGPLFCWMLLVSFCELRAEGVQLQVASSHRLIIRVPEGSSNWFRLERTRDLSDWVLMRDTLAWPTELGVNSSVVESEFYRIVSVAIPEPPFTIGVIGDSTAVEIQRFPLVGGWAQGLSTFARDETRFVMAGEPGLSTKSFFGSFRERMLTTTTPTIVMIQLGQIDEFNTQPEIKSTSLTEYQDNLGAMVDFVRGWGGIPMLVTPLPSRDFDSDGNLAPYLVERSAAMRELGGEVGVHVVDLHRLVSDLYVSASQEELNEWGYADNYHLSVPGSVAVAELVLKALPPHIGQLMFQIPAAP